MHVADAVGTPMVAIFGPTDWIVTPPFGKTYTIVRHEIECSPCLKRTCPLGHHDCMKKVGVGQVLQACEEQLKLRSPWSSKSSAPRAAPSGSAPTSPRDF